MAGPRDLKLRPGDRIRFGSLEFLVGAHPEARGDVPHLTLVDDGVNSVKLAEVRAPDSNRAAMTATDGFTTVSSPPKPPYEAECERITRRLAGLLGPRFSSPEEQDSRFSLADILIQVSGERLLSPKEQGSTEESAFVWGLPNAALAFSRAARRRMGTSLANGQSVHRARADGGAPRPLVLLHGCRHGRESTIDFDTELIPPPNEARYPPWRECFVVVPPPGAGNDPTQRPANNAGVLLSPEEIAERLRAAEERRQEIDREIEELGGVTPNRVHGNDGEQQIQTDEFGFPLFKRASQSVAAAALLADQLPLPESPEFRRVHDGLKNFLKRAAVQQAESSAERRGLYYEDGADSRSHYTTGKGAGDAAAVAQREPAPVQPTPAACNVVPVRKRLGPNRDARDTLEARRRDRSDSSDEERRAPRGRHRRDDDRRDNKERSPTPDPNDVGPRAFSYRIRTARIPP